jgi:hypothetical protein
MNLVTTQPGELHTHPDWWCLPYSSQYWWTYRDSSCAQVGLTLEEVDSNGNVTGQAIFTGVVQDDWDYNSLIWYTKGLQEYYSGWGTVLGQGPITLTEEHKCPCNGSSDVILYSAPLSLHQSASGAKLLQDVPAAGTAHSFQIEYDYAADNATGVWPPTGFQNPTYTRCDQIVGPPAGCVDTNSPGELQLPGSFGIAGASAAQGVLWAENTLPGHPGLCNATPTGCTGQMLTRLADKTTQDRNRYIMCQQKKYPWPILFTDDSCDEYTFAATYQSGPMSGVTNPNVQCNTIWPKWNGGNWNIHVLYRQAGNICVRAHVSEKDNSSVGGRLGSITLHQRLLDGDGYWVLVY